ncbi:putative ADP-ribosylglycohydrolase [Escherichia coli]|nr:putative ADP-ribosylglycohydrolase [Escherichia coli]
MPTAPNPPANSFTRSLAQVPALLSPFRAPLRWLNWHKPTRIAAPVLCANLGGDTDTIGAMATAICGALHGVNAIDPALKAELDAVNQLDFNRYATALAKYRQQREAV